MLDLKFYTIPDSLSDLGVDATNQELSTELQKASSS